MVAMSFIPSLYVSSTLVPEDPASGLKPCERQQRSAHAQHAYPGSQLHIPQCDEQGHFLPLQCHGSTGFCWCVDPDGLEVPGTRTPPGSMPPHCGPAGEPVGKASTGVGAGLEKLNGADCGVRGADCADSGPTSSFYSLLPPRTTRMICVQLCTRSCDRDIQTGVRHCYTLDSSLRLAQYRTGS